MWRRIVLAWLAYIWTVSEVAPISSSIICRYISGLNARQYEICTQVPESMEILRQAIDVFGNECQWQFRKHRWNCSNITPPILREPTLQETKETAFVYALASAVSIHQITQACSQGNLSAHCGCDTSRNGETTLQGWEWGSCSDDVKYGVRFVQDFIDARELDVDHSNDQETREALIHLHNNAAGRRAVENNMKRSCRCHGFSGSCAVRTCWMELPSIYEIGDFLGRKFEQALHVSVDIPRNGGPAAIRHCDSTSVCSTPPTTELVYIDESSDYCKLKENYTEGRYCVPRANMTSTVSDLPECESFCCNQTEFHLTERAVSYVCDCTFVWCCSVVCNTCSKNITEYQCVG